MSAVHRTRHPTAAKYTNNGGTKFRDRRDYCAVAKPPTKANLKLLVKEVYKARNTRLRKFINSIKM